MEKVKFTTTIRKDLLNEIKIQAIWEEKSVSEILEGLISDYLKTSANPLND